MRRSILVTLLGLLVSVAPARALDLARLRILDGIATEGQFGFSATVVGDMDGDGFAEYVVGAPSDETGGPGAGRVFLYRGGPQHAGEGPAFVWTGQAGDVLGYAVAAAGDLDGDGYADLLIGAPGGTSVAPWLPGRVLVIYGGPVLGARAPVVLTGPGAGSRYGAALAMLGPYCGAHDIAIGAPEANGGGLVAVLHAGAIAPFLVLHARASGDEFGTSVAAAGRTRGGAYSDLLVGAPFNSNGQFWGGMATLYLGAAAPDTNAARAYTGAHAGDFLGQAVHGLGDVNGDGLDDFAIGAPGTDVLTLVDAGRAFVYLGAATPPLNASLAVSGRHAYDELGIAIGAIGDINGDGRPDFAIGAPNAADTLATGEAQVFLGRATLSAVPDTVLLGDAAADMFGRAIGDGGAVDAGRRSLFLIGEHEHGIGGRAVLEGASTATASAPPVVTPRLALANPWPQPGRGVVHLAFALAQDGAASLEVRDVAGRLVRRLVDGVQGAGPHLATWPMPGEAPEPGLYFAVLRQGAHTESRRMVWLGR